MEKKTKIWAIGLFLLIFVSACSLFQNSKDQVVSSINADASKETIQPVACGAGTALNQKTNQCIVVNNGNSGSSSSSASSSGSAQTSLSPSLLTPPPAVNEPCREPSGVFTQLWYRQRNFVSGFLCGDACKADVLGIFRYQGNCPADIYIETGIPNAPQSASPLSVTPSGYLSATKGQPSACDANVHFNGVSFKQVQPNQVVIFELQPENYGVEGTYSLNIGAYTGCLNNGGKGMQIPTQSLLIGFSNNYQRTTGVLNKDIDESWVRVI